MKTTLDKTYFWKNKSYPAGQEIEIPSDLAKAIGLEKQPNVAPAKSKLSEKADSSKS